MRYETSETGHSGGPAKHMTDSHSIQTKVSLSFVVHDLISRIDEHVTEDFHSRGPSWKVITSPSLMAGTVRSANRKDT